MERFVDWPDRPVKLPAEKKNKSFSSPTDVTNNKKGELLSDQFSYEETKYLERGFTRRITDQCSLGRDF